MKDFKKMRPAACLFGIALIGLLGCRETPKTENEEMPEEQEPKVVNAPKQIISLDDAQLLFDTYSERRVPLIERYEIPNSESGSFSASRYAAFDYATIKEYIAFIEQEAANAKVEISGLRFYLGNNPSLENGGTEEDKANAGRNTIFVVPTLRKDGRDFGFYTRDGADGQREAALIVERPEQSDKAGNGALQESSQRAYAGFAPAVAPLLFAGEQSLVLNRGNVGPPPNNDF